MRRLALLAALLSASCGPAYRPQWTPPQPPGRNSTPPPVAAPLIAQGKHGGHIKPQPPPPPPPPVPAVRPSRVLLWVTMADLQAADPRPLGVTEAAVWVDSHLLWGADVTEGDVRAAAAQVMQAARGMPVWAAFWAFDTRDSARGMTTASDADYTRFLEHLGWLKAAADWRGIAVDGEEYAPAQPWHGTTGAARGQQFAAACSPLPVAVAVAFWQVRQGGGVDCSKPQPDGTCLRKPVAGFFDFWRAAGPVTFLNEFGLAPSGVNSAADIRVSLPVANPAPGVWFTPSSSPSSFVGKGAFQWIYVDPGKILPVAAERARLGAALKGP